MKKLSFGNMLWIYSLLFFLLTISYWNGSQVIAPHRQSSEFATIDNSGSKQLENRKFSDFTLGFIPEITEHLNGIRSGWLAIWTNKNELGRPLFHNSGFSPAYFLSWIMTYFIHDPWCFITGLSLLICFFAGLFIILFCSESELNPLVGFITGISLATSPLFMYWLTFPMFLSARCWSAGALWAILRLANRPDLLGWSVLTFSLYSLLMIAYPQLVIFHGYLLGGYGLFLTYRNYKISWRRMTGFLALAISALGVAAVLVAPVYWDLVTHLLESARVTPELSFFTLVIPKFAKFSEVVRFFVLSTLPEIFGNPVASTFPFPYDGFSVTLLVVSFAILGLLLALQKTWGWWLAITLLCLFAFVQPLYVWGVKYLGFNLSRCSPLGTILLPLIVIMAHGGEALIQRIEPEKLSQAIKVAFIIILAIIALGVSYALMLSLSIRWGMVVLMLLLAGALVAQYRQTQPWLLMMAVISLLAATAYPLMLHQNPQHIVTTSPLVEKTQANLPAGSRFALAAPGISVFPPNLNAGVGLDSVHSYNSLSPRRYHTLIKALGGELHTYGRWNSTISPDYASTTFWMSNISLILSPTKLLHENLEYLEEISGIHLHKVISRMGDSLQIIPTTRVNPQKWEIEDPRYCQPLSSYKRLDLNDVLEFEVTVGAPSVLILSQKFHPNWQAQVLSQSGWSPASTTEINGVFQGVLLPSKVQRVRLEYKPFTRYMWVGHIFWLILLAALGIKACRKAIWAC